MGEQGEDSGEGGRGYTVVGIDKAGVKREEFILSVRENHWRRMSH